MSHTRLILLSGGIESVTLLYHEHEPVRALFIDYGQRAAEQEKHAANFHCQRLGVRLSVLNVRDMGRLFREESQKKLHVPLPHRNLVALSLGLSYATQIDASQVVIGVNREDGEACPSGSRQFLRQYQKLSGALGTVAVAAPCLGLSKTEVVQQGKQLGVDYSQTYSCLLGRPQHCGLCPQCRKRRAAFTAAGLSGLESAAHEQ